MTDPNWLVAQWPTGRPARLACALDQFTGTGHTRARPTSVAIILLIGVVLGEQPKHLGVPEATTDRFRKTVAGL